MALSNAERQKQYRARRKSNPKAKEQDEYQTGYSEEDIGWHGADDLYEFLDSLPSVHVGESYTETDRARDFISTFSSESGRRVLSQIALICDPAMTLNDAEKHGRLAYKAGMRRVMAEIQRCFVIRQPVEVEREPHGKGEIDDGR